MLDTGHAKVYQLTLKGKTKCNGRQTCKQPSDSSAGQAVTGPRGREHLCVVEEERYALQRSRKEKVKNNNNIILQTEKVIFFHEAGIFLSVLFLIESPPKRLIDMS